MMKAWATRKVTAMRVNWETRKTKKSKRVRILI